jgi:hypothetical protein
MRIKDKKESPEVKANTIPEIKPSETEQPMAGM